MLAHIRGKILENRQSYVVIENNGLGYKVWVNADLAATLTRDTEANLWLFHHIKEDGQSLYGFSSFEELNFFELLISVSGVGPKSALNILSAAKINDLKIAIAMGDHAPLVKVSGIGKKTAERLVIELREKVDCLPAVNNDVNHSSALLEEIEALMALGYNANQAREALRQVKSETSQERIREALRII